MVKHQIGKLLKQVYHRGSILGLLFYLIYINDLTNNLKSNVKLFADDTSLFSKICGTLETANVMKNDLRKIHK